MNGVGFTNGAVLVSTEQVYDPRDGFATQQRYKGTLYSLQVLQAQFSAGGARVTLENDGGVNSLLVTFSGTAFGTDPETPEVPNDQWTVDTDYVQQSLWVNPKIIKLLGVDVDVQSVKFEAYVADVRALCERALTGYKFTNTPGTPSEPFVFEEAAAGSKGPLSPKQAGFEDMVLYPSVPKIYSLLLLGAEAYEVERIVVTRSRTFTAGYTQRKPLDIIGKVYSPASFVSTFSVPAIVSAQLPTPPTEKPPNTEWGYKQRGNNSTIMWSGKIQEKADWVLAAWSTLLYDYVA